MLGRGGRPPPCLLWFVARLNESENKRIIMSLNMGKSHPAALASLLGWEAPLSRRSCCLMQNPTRCSSSCAQSRARSHRPAWPAQPTIASFASTTDRLNPIQCKIQCNEIEVRTHLGKRQITDRLVHQQIGHHWKGGSEMGSQIKDWNSHESRFIPFGFDSFTSPRFTLIVS